MRLVLVLAFSCYLAYVHGESCTTSMDCQLTFCTEGSKIICSNGTCTCVTECTQTDVRCFTADQCVREDPCQNNGGCALDNSTGRPDYHCYDNRCWCGVPSFN